MEGKIEVVLKGLDCANCAAKIERKVAELAEVEKATMNFINKELIVNLRGSHDKNDTLNKVKEIVNFYEPHVKVIEKAEDESKEDEEEDLKKEIITLVLGAVALLIAILFDEKTIISIPAFIIGYILAGGEVIVKAFKNIKNGQIFDENFLMLIATIGAMIIGEFPEAVSVMIFYQVGELFQDYAVGRSRKSITALLNIKAEYANLQKNNDIVKVKPEEVNVNDIIIVKPGERVPLDGTIIEGETFLDTSALTGESVQRKLKSGDNIFSGFINMTSVIKIKVNKSFKESAVSRILDLVQNAGSRKAPTENFITKFARVYTPAVVFIAAALAIIPPFITGDAFSVWGYRALIFLVISCPCALVVSIPLGFFGGIGAASKSGILVKGGNYLEALNFVDTVIFDKTGTLTKGVFNVNKIKAYNGFTEGDLLQISAKAESFSNHPIACSIVKSYGRDIEKDDIENYEEIGGHGIKASINGKDIILGNEKIMKKFNINFEPSAEYGTIVHTAVEGVYAGYIVIFDEIKENVKETIKELKKLNIKEIVMLTGDLKNAAESVAKELGIDKVYSELLPEDKVSKIEEILANKKHKSKVIFVGDGINDAPVLARADIGVSMGGLGSDAAIEASDIVIMNDEPSNLISAIKIARSTRKIVYQNIVFALGIKALFLILGAFGMANMWEAVFADVGVALIAVFNSMRALKLANSN